MIHCISPPPTHTPTHTQVQIINAAAQHGASNDPTSAEAAKSRGARLALAALSTGEPDSAAESTVSEGVPPEH
jgi:hypothetical protein